MLSMYLLIGLVRISAVFLSGIVKQVLIVRIVVYFSSICVIGCYAGSHYSNCYGVFRSYLVQTLLSQCFLI